MIDIRIFGDRQLQRDLNRIDKELQRGIVQKAMKEAAQIVKTDAERRVPVKTGALREAIKIVAMRLNRKGFFGFRISTGGIRAGGKFSDFGGHQFYGAFLEFGAPGRFLEPRPFLRPAMDENEELLLSTMEASIRRAIGRITNTANTGARYELRS